MKGRLMSESWSMNRKISAWSARECKKLEEFPTGLIVEPSSRRQRTVFYFRRKVLRTVLDEQFEGLLNANVQSKLYSHYDFRIACSTALYTRKLANRGVPIVPRSRRAPCVCSLYAKKTVSSKKSFLVEGVPSNRISFKSTLSWARRCSGSLITRRMKKVLNKS